MTDPVHNVNHPLKQPPVDVDNEEPDDLLMFSVTTILGALDKPALVYWSAAQAAEAAIDKQAVWQALLAEEGREAAVKWLRDARFRRPKDKLAATELGTIVHACCESYALTGIRPTREFVTELVLHHGGANIDLDSEVHLVGVMLMRFDDWLNRFSPSYQATEVTVYSPRYGYAGTLDGFLSIDGVRFIFDTKTSRDPFDPRASRRPRTPSRSACNSRCTGTRSSPRCSKPAPCREVASALLRAGPGRACAGGAGARGRHRPGHPHHPRTLRSLPDSLRRRGLRLRPQHHRVLPLDQRRQHHRHVPPP